MLDGQDMRLVSVAIDGRPLEAAEYSVGPANLTIFNPPADFTLEVVTELKPQDNTALEGLYMSGGSFCTQCEAEGFRKITFFPDRPDVMARFTRAHRGGRATYPLLLSNGNLIESGDLAGRPPLRRLGRPLPQALLPVRPGRRRAGRARGQLRHHDPAARSTLRIYVEPGKAARARLRHGRSEALDDVGRGGLRPRVRPRPLHDRRRRATSTSGRWRTRG